MIISGKHTGIILIIVTLCLLVVVILFNYGSIDYKMVQAKIVEAGSEIDNRNSEIDYYVLLNYNYEGIEYNSRLYVSMSDKYKAGDIMDIKINPNNPVEIKSVIFNRYLFPFLLIIIVVDILYIRSKFFK